MAFPSGVTGSVNVNGVPYAFGKWNFTMEQTLIKRNNFTSAGYDVYVGGFIGGKFDIEGPYNLGNMPLSVSNIYTFFLGYTASVGFTVSAIVNKINPDNDADGAPSLKCSCTIQGVFNPSVI